MSSMRLRHTLQTPPAALALAAGTIGCGGEEHLTQPPVPTKVVFTVGLPRKSGH